jgi:hypothetical protein
VPMVWGDEVLPVDVPVIDNVAWLANDARGDVVRVNAESGGVDARLGLGDTGGDPAEVAQADGVALVEVDGVLRAIDVARLEWTQAVPAEGEVVVGDGAAYLVQPGGRVRALDPESLSPTGGVQLDVELGRRGVVAEGQLVVPGSDGRLHVVDRQGETVSVAVGEPGDEIVTALVGEQVVAVNLTAGRLVRWDVHGSTLQHAGDVGFDVPEGRVEVPSRLPAGPLWLLAVRSGELHQVDLDSGETDSAQVIPARHDAAGPVVAQGRVYVVDRDTGRIVEIDAETLEVVQERSLEVEDASRVDVVVQGEVVFVNDRASSRAVIIDGDEHREVDKYRGGEDPGGTAPVPPVVPGPPTAPEPPGRSGGPTLPDVDRGPPSTPPPPDEQEDDDRRAPPVPVPTTTPTTSSTTTTQPPTTTTTVPSTTTTTRAPTPPGAVTGLSASPGDGSVTVSWVAAPSPLPVTYTVTVAPAAPGGTTFPTGATSHSFTGLTNDVTYRFTVTPTNADGTGPGAQTEATPTSPETGPAITYTVVREVNGQGSGNPYEVGFDYTLGTGSPVSCSVSSDTGETQSGNCDGSLPWTDPYIGPFTIPPGDCVSFTITLTTTVDSTTASDSECAAAAAAPVTPPPSAGPPPPSVGGPSPAPSTPAPTPTPCVIDGVETTCIVAPAAGLAAWAALRPFGGQPAGGQLIDMEPTRRRLRRRAHWARHRAGRSTRSEDSPAAGG